MHHPPPLARDQPAQFDLTYYYVVEEADYPGRRDTMVEDPMCTVVANVSADFWRVLTIEGSGRLRDGRVLNYSAPCLCLSPCFTEVRETFGQGVEGRPLVPFRSVAVDPEVVAIGEPLYVRELDGVVMPGKPPWGGFVHDGCVVADDRGGHIRGRHIDFFSSSEPFYHQLDQLLHLRNITVLLDDPHCPRADTPP